MKFQIVFLGFLMLACYSLGFPQYEDEKPYVEKCLDLYGQCSALYMREQGYICCEPMWCGVFKVNLSGTIIGDMGCIDETTKDIVIQTSDDY